MFHGDLLSAAERRSTPVLLSASVSDNSDNSPQVATPRRLREIDQSTQRFHVGYDNRAIFVLTPNHADVIVDQSDAVTQNAWFCCALCAAISGEISILIQTGTESWGRFPVSRICRWESKGDHTFLTCINYIFRDGMGPFDVSCLSACVDTCLYIELQHPALRG